MHRLLVFALLIQIAHGSTCYSREISSEPYPVIQSVKVESQRACEVQCDGNIECFAFAFTPRGLQSWCALLGSPSKQTVCTQAKEVFKKQEECSTARTNITAEFGDDPCVDEIFPAAYRGGGPICTTDSTKRIIIRAVAANGSRVTFDNDAGNRMNFENGMWAFSYSFVGYSQYVPLVAAACVSASSEKCGCAPLPMIPVAGAVPALTDTLGACANPSHTLYMIPTKCSGASCDTVSPLRAWSSSNRESCMTVKCQAGSWMLWTCDAMGTFGVTALACAP